MTPPVAHMISSRNILRVAVGGIMLASCADSEPARAVLSLLPGVTPFNEMAGVHLPTRLDDLQAVRIAAQPTDYGLVEQWDGAQIRYFARSGVDEYGSPKRDAPVRHIEVIRENIPEDSAAVLWRSHLDTVASALNRTPDCMQATGTIVKTVYARWPMQEAGVVYVRRQYADTSALQKQNSISVGISLAHDSGVGPFANGVTIACEE